MNYLLSSSINLTAAQNDIGLGLENVTLHGKAHGSICPSSPLHGLISVKPKSNTFIYSLNTEHE